MGEGDDRTGDRGGLRAWAGWLAPGAVVLALAVAKTAPQAARDLARPVAVARAAPAGAPAPPVGAAGPAGPVAPRAKGRGFGRATAVPAAAGAGAVIAAAAAGTAATAAAADERLFLLYKLERLRLAIPLSAGDPGRFAETVGAVRAAAAAHLADLRGRGADPAVAALYADLVAEADETLDLAAALGRVDREAAARLKAERAETGFRAGFAGGQAGAAVAAREGASTADALAGAAAVGLFAFFLDDLEKSRDRDGARRAAREALVRDYGRRCDARGARLRAAAGRLADAHGWARGAVPVLDPPYALDQLDRLARAGAAATLRHLDGVAARRPLDPLAVLEAALVAHAASGPGGPEEGRAAARAAACGRAVALVPGGRAYDHDRVVLWSAAAWSELIAAEQGDAAAGGRAAAAAGAALAADPADPAGDLRAIKAYALAAAGDRRAAFELAGEVAALRAGDQRFAQAYTALLAEFGHHRLALDWLRHLVTACGYEDVASVRADPGLAAVAAVDPREWDRLTSPRSTWAFVPRVLRGDDFRLTNESPFPMTNVVLRPVVEYRGRRWAPELKAARLGPGETHTWERVADVPGGKPDAVAASLTCDQGAAP